MAFLDNSGDIILDAVLTDTGRKRMAKGEFQIVKFALGDDEINYELYNKDHPSGSAFYDLEIMQSPLMESVTNNTSVMHSKLMTIENPNHLYLPVMKVNAHHMIDSDPGGTCSPMNEDPTNYTGPSSVGLFLITCDKDSEIYFQNNQASPTTDVQAPRGVMFGSSYGYTGEAPNQSLNFICVDQGIDSQAADNSAPGPYTPIPSKLRETQFMVQIDHRLGRIATAKGALISHKVAGDKFTIGLSVADYHFVDDDNMATYYFGFPTDSSFVRQVPIFPGELADPASENFARFRDRNVIKGPIGSRLVFRVHAAINLQQSTGLFAKLGGGSDLKVIKRNPAAANDGENQYLIDATAVGSLVTSTNFKYIDSIVRIIGVTTGYHLDIPIRFIKKT
jgi:hypothetical protein